MDPFAFPPITALLSTLHAAVEGLAIALDPLAGSAATALAIVLVTLLVRVALIPVGVSQARADRTRRRIAPKLRALQSRHKHNPQLLQRKIAALYKAENASPFAGILPLVAQAPVVSLVYALFIRGTIGGHANLLMAASLGGVPMSASLVSTGVVWPALAVFGALLVVLAIIAWVSRRNSVRASIEPPTRLSAILSWLPFAMLIVGALVPLAAGIYLATSAAWGVAERAVLRSMLAAA
jgi:YidC/Oxa1 family membrane protein insertase